MRGSVVNPLRQRLDTLLAVEEILGAAIFDVAGQVEAAVHLDSRDAEALFTVLSSAVNSTVASANSFAAFTLSEGQVAICVDHRRAIIALTDPGLDAILLKGLLVDLLADLTVAPVVLTPVDTVVSARVSRKA
jgi:predicted regulator of Ras-like GTPase activity (Roadblock/LC7/MglB family)